MTEVGQDQRGPFQRRSGKPLIALAFVALGACTETTGGGSPGEAGFMAVPESVAEIAAPYQDLEAVRLRPEDGCFWYRHQGPVETTMLPLRTQAGNPICTRAQDGSL